MTSNCNLERLPTPLRVSDHQKHLHFPTSPCLMPCQPITKFCRLLLSSFTPCADKHIGLEWCGVDRRPGALAPGRPRGCFSGASRIGVANGRSGTLATLLAFDGCGRLAPGLSLLLLAIVLNLKISDTRYFPLLCILGTCRGRPAASLGAPPAYLERPHGACRREWRSPPLPRSSWTPP